MVGAPRGLHVKGEGELQKVTASLGFPLLT